MKMSKWRMPRARRAMVRRVSRNEARSNARWTGRTRSGWGTRYVTLINTHAHRHPSLLHLSLFLCGCDQIVADVVEAILAAAFLSGGHEVALRAAKRLQIPLPNVAQWTDFARIAAEHPTAQHAHPSVVDLRLDTVEAVQAIVGAIFSRPARLAQALVSFLPVSVVCVHVDTQTFCRLMGLRLAAPRARVTSDSNSSATRCSTSVSLFYATILLA